MYLKTLISKIIQLPSKNVCVCYDGSDLYRQKINENYKSKQHCPIIDNVKPECKYLTEALGLKTLEIDEYDAGDIISILK